MICVIVAEVVVGSVAVVLSVVVVVGARIRVVVGGLFVRFVLGRECEVSQPAWCAGPLLSLREVRALPCLSSPVMDPQNYDGGFVS